jgi:hypothetical protein
VDAADPVIQVLDGHADIGAIELGDTFGVENQSLVSFVVFPNPVKNYVNFISTTSAEFD